MKAICSRLFVLFALGALSTACDKAGKERPAQQQEESTREAEVQGFTVGQIATSRGPGSQRPVNPISDADFGRQVRHAILDLAAFHEEPFPGPRVDFELIWSVGVGSAEPPPGHFGQPEETPSDYVVLYLGLLGEVADDLRFQFEVQGIYRERLAPNEAPESAALRLLNEGVAHLVTGLEFEATPFASSNLGLVALLDTAGSETERVLPVLRHIARRRIREALPQLRALLDNDDPEILLGVIAALGEMQDAEAVSPLIDLISRRHRDLTVQVLPILGEIGTVEARQYLETVATGHQAEQVRSVALEIIQEYWGN